ncbi:MULTISPECIES: hypothetical protein [Gordonia]|uniref:Uncharacterized protein n=1 Tax=Gordonia sihwensis NBRC 108236 TaxID=1223544 RepID=L7LIJ1_9ACTN|nr:MULTISPECIES: hypothetical protein [Gordonia]AUH68664.1 hypothetical protein CXX93_10205 [Gordonia sp. YC-JH1]GAC59883.1 hypothetical protein GSI01S_06_00380 [Gordonia sihwensis NBRC 108236]
MGHIERGCFIPVDPVLHAREEAAVERIATRRFVTLDQLLDALCWSQHVGEIADELWTDIPMLKARVADLTPAEQRWIEDELERRVA